MVTSWMARSESAKKRSRRYLILWTILRYAIRTTETSSCKVLKEPILRENKFWKSSVAPHQRHCSKSVVNCSSYSRTTTVPREKSCKFEPRRLILSVEATKFNSRLRRLKMTSKITRANCNEPTNLKILNSITYAKSAARTLNSHPLTTRSWPMLNSKRTSIC